MVILNNRVTRKMAWFSFECRKVIGFVLTLMLHNWLLKNSRYFLPKLIVTCSHSFSRALRQLHVIDHFTVVCSVFWPLNGNEAGVDLVLIKTALFLL